MTFKVSVQTGNINSDTCILTKNYLWLVNKFQVHANSNFQEIQCAFNNWRINKKETSS